MFVYHRMKKVCRHYSYQVTRQQLLRERQKMKDFLVLVTIALVCGAAVGLLTYNFLNWMP